MKGKMKRLIASILVVATTLTMLPPIPSQAEGSYPESYPYNLEEQKETILQSDLAKSYENGAVTFSVSAVAVDVGNELVYHLFRQGNTDKEQTVTLATLDISAGYKKDYEIFVDGKKVSGKSNILMDAKGITYDVYLNQDVLSEAKTEASGETSNGNVQSTKEQLEEQSSSMFDVTFTRGEQIKEIRIRAYQPKKAVGNKEFQIGVYKCEDGLEEGEITVSSVTLIETREVEEAEVAIVEGSEEVVDGYVTVLVERTGNTSGYTQYNLSGEDGTAVNGEDYILKTSQLVFTPGVSKQRVHIPLVASEKEELKTFKVRTGTSVGEITYETTKYGAKTFKKTRNLVDIPMETFVKGKSNVGGFDLEEDGSRYVFGYDSPVGMGSNRGASIYSADKYNFTGIEAIRISASYKVGTIIGDHLDVYASNEDYYNNKPMLGSLESMDYGGRIDTVSLTGQGIHEVDVDRIGDYHVYMTAEQHGAAGVIGYYLYNQDYNGGDEGHVALVKTAFTLEVLNPTALGTIVPAGDVELTLTSDSNVKTKNDKVTAYRDETFKFSYTLMDQEAFFVGWQLVDTSGHVYYTEMNKSGTFTLTSELIEKYIGRLVDNTFRIRPVFGHEVAEVDVVAQDFKAAGMENIFAQIDMDNRTAIYYDGTTEIVTITWNLSEFTMGETVEFKAKNNPSYGGDYHFTAFGVEEGAGKDAALTNPAYHMTDTWQTTLSKDYYRITPIVTNTKAELLLKVSGATHGDFNEKPDGLTSDNYTVTEFEGRYDPSDIVTFVAKADEGYRAKWSYRDIATGKTKTFYGDYFYYQVQNAVKVDDNWVQLEFVKDSSALETFSVNTVVYMQGGDILHEPDPDCVDYTAYEGAHVSLGSETKRTAADGKAGVFNVKAKSGDVMTALVSASNRFYVKEIEMGPSGKSVNQDIKLSYYYEGPRVLSVQYYDYDGTKQNGDTIYLQEETEGCIIGATIEKAGKEVSDVIFKLKDSNGALIGKEYIATRNGAEYVWSTTLGMMAQEGDQIWIELVNRKYDSAGNILESTSYGEVNTGYNIVIAEFTNASYIPDTGIDKEFSVPVLGNLYFLFGVKGLKPIFTTTVSGNMTYLTLGVSMNGYRDRINKANGIPTWSKHAQAVENTLGMLGQMATEDGRIAARQSLKKKMLSVNLAVTAQLALYDYTDPETGYSQLLCVGAYMSFAFNASYLINIPFTIQVVPCFAAITISGSFADTIELYAKDPKGYVELEAMHDPTKSSYKPENDMNAAFGLGIMVGAGVNNILALSGGGSGKIVLDWVDLTYGKGTYSISVDVKLDILLAGSNVSVTVDNGVIFNDNPYQVQASANTYDAVERNLMERSLSEFKVKDPSEYVQKVENGFANLRTAGNDGSVLLSDAYEFTRPVFRYIGEDQYIIVLSVDSSLVSGLKDAGNAVLAYAIYNQAEGNYITDEEGKNFFSLEPVENVGDSINFHPCVTEVGNGKYMIVWNSIVYGESREIKAYQMRSFIKSAILDMETGELKYHSLVTEDESGQIMTGVAIDAEYDADTDEVVVLYRLMNSSGLDENSVIRDFVTAGTKLMYTSIPVQKSPEGTECTFEEGVEIDNGGKQNGEHHVIKSAQLEMMFDGEKVVPVVAYQKTCGKNANLLSTAEGGSTNHIYLTKLASKGDVGYEIVKTACVTDGRGEEYNANPQMIVNEVNGKTQNILMWKTLESILVVDPVAYLNGEITIPEGEERADANEKDYYEPVNVATLDNENAGSVGEVILFTGEDGGIYALWTQGDGINTKIMMSAMQAGKEEGSVRWGKGSVVFETEESEYVNYYAPIVDKDGNLILLYKEAVVSRDERNGHTNILIRSADLDGKLTIPEDVNLEVSDLYAKPGETVTVKTKVKNTGVRALYDEGVQLSANDSPLSGAVVSIPYLAAGEETEVSFAYTIPETTARSASNESIELSLDGHSRGSTSLESGPLLTIKSMNYEILNYVDENTPSVYKMYICIKNEGNKPSDDTYLTVSHLESGKGSNGEFIYNETLLTPEPIDVYFLEPEEEVELEFEMTVPPEIFPNDFLNLAQIGVALYENYGTADQNMLAAEKDYIRANMEPVATELRSSGRMMVGVGQQSNAEVEVYPAKAQIHEELQYESSDSSVATVDENGIITGVRKGSCEITVTSENGIKETINIKVEKDHDDAVPNDPVPNDPDPNEPIDTGDSSNPKVWGIMLMLSAFVIGLICHRRKYYS